MERVQLTCKNHRDLKWKTKSIAVNSDGTYNGMRNIHFDGRVDPATLRYIGECSCPASDLIWTDEGKVDWLKDNPQR